MKKYLLALICTALITSCGSINNSEAMKTAFVGTYTKKEGHVDGQAEGILRLKIHPKTGDIISYETVATVVNPSYVKLSKDGKYLLAVSELGPGDGESGFVYSFKVEEPKLQQISKLSTEGFAPAHIELDRTGKFALVSNYVGGVVMMYQLNEDGSLEKVQRIDLENPSESHAHSATISVDNKTAYIADLGNDKIWIYNLDVEKGKLSPATPAFQALKSGAGPRHMSVSENGNFAYSINELNNTVSVFKIMIDGGLENIQNLSSLPEDFNGKSAAADIQLHPSGKWLYASNRFQNSIAVFEVNKNSGKLKSLDFTSTEGKTPRGFDISKDGKMMYVGNQDSGTIAVFSISDDGTLELKGIPIPVPTPVKIELLKK